MEDMPFDLLDAPPRDLILAAAQDFGLTGDETWRAARDALQLCGGDPHVPAFREELVAVLALRIIATERRRIAARRGLRLAV